MSLRGCCGESEGEGAPLPLAFRFHPDPPPMHLDKAPGDEKAQARSLGLYPERGLEPRKWFEELRLILWRYPDAGILHADLHIGLFMVHG